MIRFGGISLVQNYKITNNDVTELLKFPVFKRLRFIRTSTSTKKQPILQMTSRFSNLNNDRRFENKIQNSVFLKFLLLMFMRSVDQYDVHSPLRHYRNTFTDY